MNDREFIELLNLYVDHEISAEDSLRLEAEVLSDPSRREVYDQYCRMQKACSMLSEELMESAPDAAPNVIEFPAQRRARILPVFAGLAAAAAIALVFVNMRDKGAVRDLGATLATSGASAARPAAIAAYAPSVSDSMKPVFFVRMPSEQMTPGGRAIFSPIDTSSQMAQLNWIGAVHMTPVFTAANPGFLLNPKTDLKAAVLTDSQNSRDDQEQSEMTAFRFQR